MENFTPAKNFDAASEGAREALLVDLDFSSFSKADSNLGKESNKCRDSFCPEPPTDFMLVLKAKDFAARISKAEDESKGKHFWDTPEGAKIVDNLVAELKLEYALGELSYCGMATVQLFLDEINKARDADCDVKLSIANEDEKSFTLHLGQNCRCPGCFREIPKKHLF